MLRDKNMQKIKRYIKFLGWFKYEHINKHNILDTYQLLSRNASYDKIVDFDKRSNDLEKLVKDIKLKDKKVLDIACGSGAFIQAVIGKGPEEIVGVDISVGMLELARKRFAGNKNVRFINESFMDVNFKNAKFDLILLANASRYIPKGKENIFFSKVTYWLKKDGIFLIHSDLIGGLLGKILAPIMTILSNPSNLNPNTSFEWNLEKELQKNFLVKNKLPVGREFFGRGQHTAFICMRQYLHD